MPTTTKKPLTVEAAVRKIQAAIAKGVIPSATKYEVDGNRIEIGYPYWSSSYYSRLSSETYDWVVKTFPGGEVKNGGYARSRRGRSRKQHYDAYEYRAEVGQVIITVSSLGEHVHRYYHASSESLDKRTGLPKWYCTACKQTISTTRARELGLLPAKAA